jgi:hypothetical protein
MNELTSKEMQAKLPEHYIMFPDNEELAKIRLSQIEEKLRLRGYVVVRPLNGFRISWPSYSMLAFQLTKV